MKYLLTSGEMKACDSFTIHTMGVPSMVLMERAALAAVEEIEKSLEDMGMEAEDGRSFLCGKEVSVLVICGSGNNGGDGFAIARLLLLKGICADVYFAGDETHLTQETARQKLIFENYQGKYNTNPVFSEYTILVDAIFGIGLSRTITGRYEALIDKINASCRPVVAVDIPSGVNADTGEIMGCAVTAQKTVSFGFAKRGQVLYPGREYCGDLLVKDIGITSDGLPDPAHTAFCYTDADLKLLPARRRRSNKGTYGTVLLIAGDVNMAGAAVLSGKAAYRTGCGLVRIMSHEKNREIIQTALPEAVYLPMGEGEQLQMALTRVTAVGIGPGLGTGEASLRILASILGLYSGPLVMDADALNLIAKHPDLLKTTKAQLIITPHPGEMSRLCGRQMSELLNDIPGACARFAGEHRLICLLKDAVTSISDGSRLYLNSSGCDGMAAGGSGDVLTGIICSLLAQGMAPFEAACMAAFVHGRAGEEASRKKGNRGMMALDLADSIFI